MTTINLICTGASVQADVCGELTSGMAGIEVNIDFDTAWDGLTPTFYAGNTTDKAVPMAIDAGGLTKIPPEVMISGKELLIGARGVNAAGDIILPTRWACVGMIDSSPDDAEKVAPKPPVTPDIVDQIKAQAYAASVNAAESKEAAEGAQLSAGESAASAAESAAAANRAAGEASGAKQAAAEAVQKSETAEGKADTALSIASGASRAFTAETFQELQAWLRDPANAGKLMRGDNLYIVALDTPDYWVVSPMPSADPETGYYYRIAPLETSKVDLSGYAKLSQLSPVATSGDYNDLRNKPTIPADQSQKIEELEKASTALKKGLTQVETAVNGKYSKPTTGIPETDLSTEVKTKLNSGGGGGGENWEVVLDTTLEEPASEVIVTTDSHGNPLSSRKLDGIKVLAFFAVDETKTVPTGFRLNGGSIYQRWVSTAITAGRDNAFSFETTISRLSGLNVFTCIMNQAAMNSAQGLSGSNQNAQICQSWGASTDVVSVIHCGFMQNNLMGVGTRIIIAVR